MKRIVLLTWISFHYATGFSQPVQNWASKEVRPTVFNLTRVMLHDDINPPAAARFYAYSMMAGYEVISHTNSKYVSLKNQIKAYPKISLPPAKNIEYSFASLYAILETGRQIIPSGQLLTEDLKHLYDIYKSKGVKKQVLDESKQYAIEVARLIVSFAKTDGYFALSTFTKYQPKEQDSTWYPTPPEYMAAVEPYWNTVRTFFISRADQFRPSMPTTFSEEKDSYFFKQLKEVYETSKQLSEEQKLIANYWDCNPFAVYHSGHMNIGIKKISPGGHWMNIAGQACEQAKFDFEKSIYVQTIAAMTLHDAFVSCWDEKYRSDRIRPKTAINKYLDEKWEPLLQTPPFPEYTSGHSVISSACATVLTYFFGEAFSFTDQTEKMFGMPERTFNSFQAASSEAAISRLYGGIHFRDAIEAGQAQGKAIGQFVIQQLP
jgi:hypothetical protein